LEFFMETSTTTSHATCEAKVTSHYWGYRELTADEVSAVAGGYDGNGGPGSDSPDSNNAGGSAGSSESMAAAQAEADRALALSQLTGNITTRAPLSGFNLLNGFVNSDIKTSTQPTPTGNGPGGNIGIGSGEFTQRDGHDAN
jgi:hypothetical protein